ncbi:hypothetical protein G3580_00270 [Nitrogeniibacter mangrovi]|uniref:Uncharacterized protein n=1 Tax=Nitrogeniibacter mangrovi TaxID=2016596 RepID=A0A6C1B1P8_9RHOO|nr:hypothetical protein [Nitrogeniibacter mangrovi]QID16194.1 hypothetical protein G3580_00270 [Nitrogeniibacter mangrovi]
MNDELDLIAIALTGMRRAWSADEGALPVFDDADFTDGDYEFLDDDPDTCEWVL